MKKVSLPRTHLKSALVVIVVLALLTTGITLTSKSQTNNSLITNSGETQASSEQELDSSKLQEISQPQPSGEEKIGAKPGEVGEVLIDQPKKGIKYIRGGTLSASPGAITCYQESYCSPMTITTSTSDGKAVRLIGEKGQENKHSGIIITCRGDCWNTGNKTSWKIGIDASLAKPGTYNMQMESMRDDAAGNHIMYYGTFTVIVKAADPTYIPTPEPEPDYGTPPHPIYSRPPAPSYCNGPSMTQPECY